jgi:hypothetical protein
MKLVVIKTCQGFQTLLLLDGALVREQDIQDLPRNERVRVDAHLVNQNQNPPRLPARPR